MSDEVCKVCGKKVQVQIQKGTGLCGDLCRKESIGETVVVRASVHAAMPVVRINKKKIL